MERSAEETHFWTGTPCSSSDIHSDTETNTQTYKDRGDWRLFNNPTFDVQLYFKNKMFPETRVRFSADKTLQP